jgi:hypothetical protein
MRAWDLELICRMIEGGIASYCFEHPDKAIPKDRWRSISKRSAAMVLMEFRKRFGNPVDQVLARHVAHEVLEVIEQSFREAGPSNHVQVSPFTQVVKAPSRQRTATR